MRWIALFTDTPDMLAIRAERGEQHLAYLRAHTDEILIAGGCREAPGEPFVGGGLCRRGFWGWVRRLRRVGFQRVGCDRRLWCLFRQRLQ